MERRFWAPGRVNLIGEHTDTTGGFALPVAIDLGISLTVTPSDRISLVSGGDRVELAPDGRGDAVGWGRYVSAAAAELAELGRPAVGIEGIVEADLPSRAGLGSSAALEVATALALNGVADFELDPHELARACRRAELRAVGVPCGILDQAASVFGRAGSALFLDCETLESRHVRLPEALALVVIDSGEKRDLAHSAYAKRVDELRDELNRFEGRRPREISADELSANSPRLRHVVTENGRVLATADALEREDLEAVGELFAASHESLRMDYDVSTPQLDRLVSLALAEGARAARLTGGGFGGSILALVRSVEAIAFGERVRERAGGSTLTRIVNPSDGAGER